MPNPAFPTLVTGKDDWSSFEEDYQTDPTVRSRTSDGRPLSRPGTGPALKVWRYTRRHVSSGEKGTLQAFEVSVGFGGEPFTWTDSRVGGSSHTVKFASLLRFRPARRRNYYDVEIHIAEEPAY